MKFRILIFAISTILLISGCRAANDVTTTETVVGLGENSQVDPVSSVPAVVVDFNYVFNSPQDTVNIVVELDTAQGVEGVIPVEGGSLTAKGADGTSYTLEIPSDALLTETRVKMTPVASISDLPFGGDQTYAVQLEPEGLFFNNFVVLTITPAQEMPLDQQITFGYQKDGDGLVIAPPQVDAKEIKIQLLHFSGY